MANDYSPSGSGQPYGLSVTLAPGVRVGGARYILKRVLGRGDGTVVWLARDVRLEAEVALKVLPEFLVRDPNIVERLKTDIARLTELKHANITRTLDLVRDHSCTAIATEYVEGWSLVALRVDKPQKRYLLAEITPWIRQLCAALDYAHNEAASVHGHLKTSNLMLDQRDQIKVMDFGIDRVLRSLDAQGSLGRIAATLGFMSPQQALGEKPSVLDDVYSLGATIYDLLTGTPPFYKGQVLAQVCERKPETMSERLAELGINDSVSSVVEDAVAMCLEKEPARRPPNVSAVLKLLERSEVPVTEVTAKKEEATQPEKVFSVQYSVFSGETAVPEVELNEPAKAIPEPVVGQVSRLPTERLALESTNAGETPDLAGETPAPLPPAPGNRFILAAVAGVVLVLALGFWLAHSPGKGGRVGTVDARFTPATNADHEIRAAVVQPDKKILIGGMFTQLGGGTHRSLARLNPDGSVDDSFTGTTGGDVHALALQPDGHIIIAGEFGKVNDSTRRRIARLNPDGSLDESFRATAGANRDIRAVLLQPDGKILFAGGFDLSSGKQLNRIGRFNPDGTRDNTFDPGAGAPAIVWSLALQRDNKIIVGGDFTTFDRQPYCRVARLNINGKVDETFTAAGGANGQVFAVAVQGDGKILLGGDFIRVNGAERNHVARLNADGSLDASFDPGAGPNSGVRCLAAQADGKLLIGGIFTSVQGVARSRIARLKADGSLDGAFDPGAGVNEVVRWVGLEPEGGVLIAGGFTKCDGLERVRIARLKGG